MLNPMKVDGFEFYCPESNAYTSAAFIGLSTSDPDYGYTSIDFAVLCDGNIAGIYYKGTYLSQYTRRGGDVLQAYYF